MSRRTLGEKFRNLAARLRIAVKRSRRRNLGGDATLGGAQRGPGHASQMRRQLSGPTRQLLARLSPLDQTETQRFRTVDRLRANDEAFGRALTAQPGQPLGATGRRKQAEPYLRQS